jgi:predicted secreted protein
MPWLRFLADYDFRPPEAPRRIRIAYKAGMVQFVRRVCADEATAAGKAELTERPTK